MESNDDTGWSHLVNQYGDGGGGGHRDGGGPSIADESDDSPVRGSHRAVVRASVHREREVSHEATVSPLPGQHSGRPGFMTGRSGELSRQCHDDREPRQQRSRSRSRRSGTRQHSGEFNQNGELSGQGHIDRESRQQRSRDRSIIIPVNNTRLRRMSGSPRNQARSEVRRSRSRSASKREPLQFRFNDKLDDSRSQSPEANRRPGPIMRTYNEARAGRIKSNHNMQHNRKRLRSRSPSSSPADRQSRSRYYRSKSREARRSSDAKVYEHESGYIDRHNRKRYRSRSPSISPPARRARMDASMTHNILDKFLNIMESMKGQSSSKLSLHNVIPEFDPMVKNQTVVTWLTKVEECASIYGWSEKETIHFALPKLTGVAKSWYQALDTVLYSWSEWKRKLIESFPCREDYAELLTIMLAKRVRYGESFVQYYYEKMNLLNRCNIKGRKAVDCLLHGIEDRAVRVGAQAAQFHEPEDVLKYLQTVKVGNVRESDKIRQEKRSNVNGNKTLRYTNTKDKSEQPKKILRCYNCETEGHRSIECEKAAHKCTLCSKIGHKEIYCRKGKADSQIKGANSSNVKDEKQIAELSTSEEINKKFIMDVEVNGKTLTCYVDLGSQCTLITKNISTELNLCLKTDHLPVMRGIGGHCFTPIGRCYAEVTVQGIKETVEIFVVENDVLRYPMLLGHSFTEKPNIVITKTTEQIIFERISATKLFLKVQSDLTIPAKQMKAVTVYSSTDYTGEIYVHGTVRGKAGAEHYLLPGEYKLDAGIGRLLVQNFCDQEIIMEKDCLLTRAIPAVPKYDISTMMFADTTPDDRIQCGPDVTTDQKLKLQNLLSKYGDCFSTGLKDLGFTEAGEMVIELTDSEPVVYRPYRMSNGERAQVRDMVQDMLDAGIVRESSSPYASPIVMVNKKTGEKRLCVDYRALNRRTKKDHFPLPRIEDQLDQLAGSKVFISLDLASGYYQIPISEASRYKTAFVTPDGQYEYTRMPFGLVNAPSVFQRTMNKILSDAKIKYALIYMDDVLIPAGSFEEGLERLEEVLSLLKQGGLTLKLSKCKFFFKQIDFLGFEVSANGVKPGAIKTEAVEKFPAPKNVHELRQFIGLASFFRRFVKGFAQIARPLTDLLKKNSEWQWSESQEQAFRQLKNCLVQRPLLALYDPHRETQVHTDACKKGVGGVLLQKCDEGLLRPVAYFSRKTTAEEERLHSFELETLAVVACLARFRVYLIGIPFKILTDCNALRTTLTKRDLVPRIARWWIQLQEFDCQIEYRAGVAMQHADALSRNPVGEATESLHVLDVLTVDTEDWIATVQSSDEEIIRIKSILCDPEAENVAEVIKNYKLKNGKIFRKTGVDGSELRWVVPKGVRWQILKMNHDDLGHFGFEKTLARIQQTFWFPKLKRFVKKYVRSCLECAHKKGSSGKQEGELHPIPKTEIPFHTIHADHLGPFVRSSKGNSYLLVIVDGFTKFVNITPVKNTKSSSSIKVLREHISYFGTPTRLITDRGTSFTSAAFRTFTKSHGIKHILNAVATPRANGQVERFNRSILEALSTKCPDKNDKSWDDHVYSIQLGLNTTIHKTTGKSPSELVFGFKVSSGSENVLSDVIVETINRASPGELHDIRSDAGKRIGDQQAKDKERFDAKRKPGHVYSVGDLVSIKRDFPSDGRSMKLAPKFQGPYRIAKILPNERFVVENTPLTKKKGSRNYDNVVAIDKLKPWLSFDKNFGSSSESEAESEMEITQE